MSLWQIFNYVLKNLKKFLFIILFRYRLRHQPVCETTNQSISTTNIDQVNCAHLNNKMLLRIIILVSTLARLTLGSNMTQQYLEVNGKSDVKICYDNNTSFEEGIVSKVSKWDNLVLRSADFYFSIVIKFFSELLLYLYSNGKKGK